MLATKGGNGRLATVKPSIRFTRPNDAETLHRFICALADTEREPEAVELDAHVLREQSGLASSAPG